LRAAGVPDNAIAGLVVSQFEENWQKRVDDLQKEIDNGANAPTTTPPVHTPPAS